MDNALRLLPVSTLLALLAVGCDRTGLATIGPEGGSGGGSSGGEGGSGGMTGKYAGQTPVNHRPSDAQCSAPSAPGECLNLVIAGCTGDGDCTSGTNGRCITSFGGYAPSCVCTYDTCMQDTDCPHGQTCACHGSAYVISGSTCVAGNCRVDADCGAGGYCSPSPALSACGNGVPAGYYCHTTGDLCIDDSNCTATNTVNNANAGGLPMCAYSTTDTRWECFFTGACG